MMLKEGTKAPDFVLKDYEEKEHKLSDYKGKKVVLYFYPKDDTPGCTKEACGFRDAYDDFKNKGAVVLGVSKDDSKSHGKFVDKYSLPFTLLSDPDHKVIEKYGAWGERSFMGRKYMGTARITYLVDEQGKILKVFPKVKPEEHAKEILDML